MTSEDSPAAISSRGLRAGNSRSASRAGEMSRSGPAHARANHSPAPAGAKVPETPAISGRSSTASSRSAALQSSLASRLMARMDVNGSLEYEMTWKRQAMPRGRPICLLRASRRYRSASAFGGWRSPAASDGKRGRWQRHHPRALRSLATDVLGWVSPTAQDGVRGSAGPRPHDTGIPLSQQVVGWATLSARDSRSEAGPGHAERMQQTRGKPLSRQVAGTDGSGGLNPEFGRWLTGFPDGWSCFAPTGTR